MSGWKGNNKRSWGLIGKIVAVRKLGYFILFRALFSTNLRVIIVIDPACFAKKYGELLILFFLIFLP